MADGERGAGLRLERLEDRMLLALTISQDVVQAGDITYSDSDSITINAGVMLKSTGGKITLDAPSITILDNARLLANEAVELQAEKTFSDTPLTIFRDVFSIVEAFQGTKATVTIGSNVTINGDSLTIATTAGDDRIGGSVPFLGQALEIFGEQLDDIIGLPFALVVRQPSAAVTIGTGTQIVTTGDVSITGKATANAKGKAIWSIAMDNLVKTNGGQANQGWGVAAGFSYADATATVDLESNAKIQAGGKVEITSDVESTGEMESRVTLNQGLQRTDPKNIEVALAGAYNKATSKVTIDTDAAIVAQKNVDITASATDETTVKPSTASYRDGRVGVVFGEATVKGTVEVIVQGSITAGKVIVPAALSFNPALAVDFAARAIDFPSSVEFRTGDEVIYSPGDGGAIPGLVAGRTYYAIVDPAAATRLRLAETAADAALGRAVDFGAGYPTLTTPKGTLPIVSVDADGDDTLWFGFDRWPDGVPLFADGQTVGYAPVTGQFLGQNDAAGSLIGPLPAGNYTVQLVPNAPGDVGMRIRLLDAAGTRIDLNANPQFVTEAGAIHQVKSFDEDMATVSFGEQVALSNAQKIRYVQAFGSVVTGLVDGRDYFAVVDPQQPGVIQLADSLDQARAADPAVQNAVPTLVTTESDPASRRTIAIGDVHPATGLVFSDDPQLTAGTPVVYRAVPGKPVGGLVDGVTYYAYPLDNPYFDPNFPQYVVGLRVAADPASPLIDYELLKVFTAGDTDLVINGIDGVAGALSLALPQRAVVVSADPAMLVGGTVAITTIPAGSPQVWNNATGGTFTISLPDGDGRRQTAAIPFDATPAAVRQAINVLGLAGVAVTAAYGRGVYQAPWTLVGTGLDDLQFDWTNLAGGGAVWSRLTREGLQAVSTTASGGTFTLTLDAAGSQRATAAIPFNASATAVQASFNGIAGVLAGQVTGSGRPDDPWIAEPRIQPLRTGDPVVFRDAWGSSSPGLLDGQTYYVVVAPTVEQGRDDSVVVRLAATPAAAIAPEPVVVPLSTTIAFGSPTRLVMSGTGQSITSTIEATGINLAARLTSTDTLKAASANGNKPGPKEWVTQGDFKYASGAFTPFSSKLSTVQQRITDKLGSQEGQQSNDFITASASVGYLSIDNTARVLVDSTAVLKATGAVNISSTLTENLGSSVVAEISKPTAGQYGVAVAVDVVTVTNRSHAIVAAGAQVTGGDGVTVNARTTYPWEGELWKSLGYLDSFSDFVAWIKDFAKILGTDWHKLLVTHYSASGARLSGEGGDQGRLEWSVAGNVSWVGISNDTVARIEDGALINQDSSILYDDTPVTVKADTTMSQVGFTGNPYLYRLVEGAKAIGGSVGYLEIANNTRALLGGMETDSAGTPLRTASGPLQVYAGSKGVNVNATNDTFVIQLTDAGDKATNFGFSGAASYLDADSSPQVTEAAIQGPAASGNKAVVRSIGPVAVTAADSTYLIPIAGAVVLGDGKGVGVSVSIARLDRDVTARVGSKDDEPATLVDMTIGNVTAGGGLTTAASADGAVTPTALAGTVISQAKPAGDQQNVADKQEPIQGAGNQPQGAFGLAVSGDFTLAAVKDDVRATVNTSGTIAGYTSSSVPPAKLEVSAKNTTVIQAIGGAAAMLKTTGDGSSASLAGSAAIIDAESTVIASVRRATLTGFTLDVSATNERKIGAQAASGSGAMQPRQNTGTNVQVAGSVTVATITTTTKATIESVTATTLGGLSVAATTRDTTWSAAGSFLANFSPAGGAAGGRCLGVGLAFAWNHVTATTEATVVDSTLTANEPASVTAVDASRLFTFAAGVVVVNAGSSLGGMFAIVNADSTVNAEIDGGSLDVSTGDLDVAATSALLIVTAAGDLVIGRGQGGNAAVGAAVAIVGGTLNTTARVGRGTVRVRKGRLTVSSQSRNPDDDPAIDAILDDLYTPHREETAIWSFAIGVVWAQSTVTADFSVNWNTLTSTRSATIEDGATVTVDDGALEVQATDEASIYSGAGAIALSGGSSGKVAAGAAVVRNAFTGNTVAKIDSSTVSVKAMSVGNDGNIDVSANGGGLIGTAAVGGDVAGKLAVGTALIFNDIKQTVDARITNTTAWSTVTADGAVNVAATDHSRIGAGAGQVSVATSGSAAGAAAAVNTIDSTVNAIIEWAAVTSSQDAITVEAKADGEIYSYAMGVAGAFSGEIVQFAGVGSGTGNTLVRRVQAAVQSAQLTSKSLTVTASDTSEINTAAGTVAIQYSSTPDISVAVGVSASTNTIGSATDESKRSFVEAVVRESSVSLQDEMEVSASSTLAIQAITAAGALNFSGSGGSFIGLAGAGAGSGNTVQMDVTAALQDSTVTQKNAGGISVTADNQTSVYAVAGGVAVAGSSAAESKGIAVTVGAAASVNTVAITTQALVEGKTTITSPGTLTVAATGAGSIKAVSFGVAGALRAGGSTFDLTGAGTAAINTVTTTTLAAIQKTDDGSPSIGSATGSVGSVDVTAKDTSSIVAGAGALSSKFDFGKGTSVALSIGVSFTVNEVSGTVTAAIEDADVYASGDVSVSADYTNGQNATNVYSVTVAGAVDVSAGSGGALIPLAGAGSRNTVAMTTLATISNSARVQAGGHVSVTASDTSAVYSNAGGVSLGLQFGGDAGAVAGGAAYGKNQIRNTVWARIENATVTGDQGVTVKASASQKIDSLAYGVALSVAVAGVAISAAGSGASGFNTITNSIDAAILSSTVTAASGDVSVEADATPEVTSKAGAGALAVAIGDGVALAPGVVIIESSISDTVTARIDRADGSQVDPTVTATAGAVNVQATSAADVTSLGVAVAASVAIGEATGAFAGAGAHGSVTFNSKVTASIDAGSVTATAVQVAATNGDSAMENTIGTGAGAFGLIGGSIGVSLTETTASNAVTASIGAAKVSATSGGITVDVRGGNSLAAESVATSVAVALGAAGAGGHAFSTDTSTYKATVASGATLTATGALVVQARGSADDDSSPPDGTLDAQAYGYGGGLVVVGVVIAETTDATQRTATIDDGVNLSNVATLEVTAISSPNVSASSEAIDVGGVAVTVNQSTVTTSGSAVASIGKDVTLPQGDVLVKATGVSKLDASQYGAVGGLLAAGATQTTGNSGLRTEAKVGDVTTDSGRTGALTVQATSHDVNTSIKAESGSGGLFNGFGTTGDLTDSTTTRATIGGVINAGTVDVSVSRYNDGYDVEVDSTNITLGLGVGITRATFTADQKAQGLDRVGVVIGDLTAITATGPVTIAADHRISRSSDNVTVNGVGGSVLVSGQQAVSNVKVQVPASITMGHKVQITSGTDPLTQPGGITILPTASLEIKDSAALDNLGLLVSGGHMASYLEGGVSPQVTIGDDARLVSHGRLNIGTTAFVAAATSTSGWGAALFGGVGTYATSDVTVDQRVTIGERATLASDGSLNVTPGDDPTGSSSTYLTLDATARASSYGVVAIPVAQAKATLNHSSDLSFGAGANVSSGGNMYLTARAIQPTVTATGEADGDIAGIPKTDSDGTPKPSATSSVKLDNGTFLAGRENALAIVIPNDRAGGFTNTVNATPSTLFGKPVADKWEYVSDFNPVAYIDGAGFSPEVASALKSGVAQGPVGAIRFKPDNPIFVSGGSVNVTADTISASSATLTGRTAQVSIDNESPDYLVLGGITIANIEGGRVSFLTSAGDSAADPTGASINRDKNTVPTITVNALFNAGVGGSDYGPAIFVAGALENLGGNVVITNTKGSFGQTGTIAAKQISIDTPNGVFAVDTPSDPWNAAGTPAAQLADFLTWPGGDPRKGPPNADQAVMYAINAMSGIDDPGVPSDWRDSVTEALLNNRVYGFAKDSRTLYVPFGGSTPQYDNDTNTEAKSDYWARNAWTNPREGVLALQMSGNTKPGTSGWDHAYVPELEPLAYEFPQQTIPSQASGTAVKGQVIVINARVANINGQLEAGGAQAGDQSVEVPASLEAVLRDYQKRYRLGEVTAPVWRIPDSMLGTKNPTDRLIGASFDARTGQIILDDAISSGGGSVSITGKIINTDSAAGKIVVKGGSGNITVDNDTSLPVVTGNLLSSIGDARGVVRLTDLNVADVSQQQTAYVYDGEKILVYRGAAGVDLISQGDLRDRVVGATTVFTPQPNARWQWQLDASLSRSVSFTPGDMVPVSTTRWRFENPDSPWQTPGGAAEGDVVFDVSENALEQVLSADPFDSTNNNIYVDYKGKFSWDTGFSPRNVNYPQSASIRMTMSLKADNPIGIDFGGTSVGQITVTSTGAVVVGGRTAGSTVSIESTGEAIATSSVGGFIDAPTLVLKAFNEIGTATSPIAISTEVVSATTQFGDIFLDGRRGDPTEVLSVKSASAPKGTISIVAAGDLAGGWVPYGWSPFNAPALSFTSIAGRIGTTSAPIVAVAADGNSVRFDASAAGDVSVRLDGGGDMLVGRIVSATGSVRLRAAGNIYNALTWTIDPTAAEARMKALIALGATDPNAYKADVTAFEGNVTSQYFLFWSLQRDGNQLSLWRLRTAQALNVQNPTDGQITAYVTQLKQQVSDFFTQTIGTDYRSRPEFQAFVPTYKYQATDAQIDQFRKNRTVTEAQLALQLEATALDTPPAGESVDGDVNISARDVQLTSTGGSVGKNDESVTITATDLASGNLTRLQAQELALAANPGDAKVVDGGLLLNVRRPVILAATGRVDVYGAAGVAIAQKTGDLRVGNIGSQNGVVSVIADGSILNAPDRTIDMWGAPLGFSEPSDWTRVGTAGQTLSATKGLYIPGYASTASGTWFNHEIPTGSFRASFTYQATAEVQAGDGLAFVLQDAGTSVYGAVGGGLGYSGIPGKKAAFLINVYQANGVGTYFDKDGTWNGGQFKNPSFPLTGRPVYVTLVYNADARTMTATVSDQPAGQGGQPQTITYDNVDLGALLGPTAFIGFTSGTGSYVTSQQVTDFEFAADSILPAELVTFPINAWTTTWATTPSTGGFEFEDSISSYKDLVFPETVDLAAAAWYPTPVRVSTDFSVRFTYHYAGVGKNFPADGMALVFQNSPDGLAALGTGGGGLGYSGIPGKKVGYLINIYSEFSAAGTRFDTQGSTGNYRPVDLLQPGTDISITLSYDASAKTMTETLSANGKTYTNQYHDIDMSRLVGGTATIGFTAASGAFGASQRISNFSFSAPAARDPSAGDDGRGWELNGTNGTVQWLSNGGLTIPAVTNTATSTWYRRPVTTRGFEVSYTYQASGPNPADGLAFVLQQSPEAFAALGNGGGGLGYIGMTGPKVGFLMNIYGTPGVRFDDGSESGSFDPVPWLTTGPVVVNLLYDAQAKTMITTLSQGDRSYAKTWKGIDLGAKLGTEAIMGFTSGTGQYAATQTVSNFAFFDSDGIESFLPVVGDSPTVRLWSTEGDIGASGDEIDVQGRFDAQAPKGSIHTNPPPQPSASLATIGFVRPDGLVVTRDASVVAPVDAPGNVIRYSVDNGRTWRKSFKPVEGLNRVLVVQVNTRGFSSEPKELRFVLDTKAPPPPTLRRLDGVGGVTRTGLLGVLRVRDGATIEYSVNGGPWSTTYTPVAGANRVRVRQVDRVGNVSRPSAVMMFTLKTSARPVGVSLVRDIGSGTNDHVSRNGRLRIAGREQGAIVQYSVDGGRTWQRTFKAVVGINRLEVRQIDRVGNISTPTAFVFTLEAPRRKGISLALWRSRV